MGGTVKVSRAFLVVIARRPPRAYHSGSIVLPVVAACRIGMMHMGGRAALCILVDIRRERPVITTRHGFSDQEPSIDQSQPQEGRVVSLAWPGKKQTRALRSVNQRRNSALRGLPIPMMRVVLLVAP